MSLRRRRQHREQRSPSALPLAPLPTEASRILSGRQPTRVFAFLTELMHPADEMTAVMMRKPAWLPSATASGPNRGIRRRRSGRVSSSRRRNCRLRSTHARDNARRRLP